MTQRELEELIRTKIRNLENIPEEFINDTVRGGQIPLFEIIISEFADELDLGENGEILNTPKNMRLVAQIDSIWKTYQAETGWAIIQQHITNMETLVRANAKYYGEILGRTKKFNSKSKNITSIINRRLGLNTDGTLIKAGYMGDIFEDATVKNQIKEFAIRSVSSQEGFDTFKRELGKLIKGDPERLGILQKYYRNIAYDVYKQVDGLNNKLFAEEFKLNYFIYDGTIIKTTRTFCRKRCNLIFTREQAAEWINDPDLTAAPLNYDPLVDMGGYACRHIPRFLTDDMAFDLDPSLKPE